MITGNKLYGEYIFWILCKDIAKLTFSYNELDDHMYIISHGCHSFAVLRPCVTYKLITDIVSQVVLISVLNIVRVGRNISRDLFFLPTTDTIWENRSPYRLQQKTADI